MSFAPTGALQRALPIAVPLIMMAVLLSRLDALLLATPFIVWLGWAIVSRPARDVASAQLEPHGRVAINEGEAFRWSVTAPDGGTVSAAWAPRAGISIVGDSGTADGEVSGEFHPESWGRFTLGSPTVAVTDPSGAWRAQPELPPLAITVAPAAETLDGGAGVARPLGISGAHTSKHRGSGSALATVREFQPGDRLRQLHWRVTARTGRPHVVATHSDRDTDVLIILDTLGEIMDATADSSSLDMTVRAMSSIAQHYVRLGDRVALHDMGNWIGSVPRGTGQRQAMRIIDAGARADRTRRPLAQPIRVPSLQSGTMVFVISTLLEPRVLDEVVRLRQLGGEVICIDVLPSGAGSLDSLAAPHEGFLPEALVLLRAQRNRALVRLQELGLPVVSWSGPGSLAAMLLAMSSARAMPRARP